ncbi:DUF3592 domain-containing protein [Actinoplanes sp. NPDC051851]|uniref:DUF3592 domain-containing protein n=1 Tax=Actinoplanes sp. NPDC051851 TaxID=3154753 RepID=UPI00342BC51E
METVFFGLVFMAVGAVVIGVGVRHRATQRLLASRGVAVPGRVESLEIRRTSGTSGSTVSPVISFRDGAGLSRTFRLKLGGSSVRYPVGSAVPVRYLPENPEVADLDAADYRGWSYAVTFGTGAVFFLIGLASAAYGITGP